MIRPSFALERQLWERGLHRIAGIDEAGRGAWAGPLTVAAVILPPEQRDYPFRDSKTLSSARRSEYAQEVKRCALSWAVEFASHLEIDQLGVLRATHAAALRAVARLEPAPDGLVTDYLKLGTALPLLAPPRADQDSFSVAAASLLAKVARDAHLLELDALYPGYGFAQHKGYGVEAHRRALERLGPCPEHRVSFAPVRKALEARLL